MAHTLTTVEPIWPVLQNISKTMKLNNDVHDFLRDTNIHKHNLMQEYD